jgi:hypothetical protein
MAYARRMFAPFLLHLDPAKQAAYWNDVETPYISFYAFEEIPAVLKDESASRQGLLAPSERIASWITDEIVSSLYQEGEKRRRELVDKYAFKLNDVSDLDSMPPKRARWSAWINTRRWVRRYQWRLVAGLCAGAIVLGYRTFEASQQAAIATQHFKLSVNAAQTLLKQLSDSVDRGDITIVGANDMLNKTAGEIVAQGGDIRNTKESISLLIHLGYAESDIYATLKDYTQAYMSAKNARDLAEKLPLADQNNSEVLQILCSGNLRMGDAIALQGIDPTTQEGALKEYRDAEKLAYRLVELAPKDAARQCELMVVYQKIGDVYEALQKPERLTEKELSDLSRL